MVSVGGHYDQHLCSQHHPPPTWGPAGITRKGLLGCISLSSVGDSLPAHLAKVQSFFFSSCSCFCLWLSPLPPESPLPILASPGTEGLKSFRIETNPGLWGTIPGRMGVLPAHPLLPVVATSLSTLECLGQPASGQERGPGCEPGLISGSCAGPGPKHQAAWLTKWFVLLGVRGRERLLCPGASQFPLPSPRLPP